jgi:predicted transcriptional regulator
MQLDFTPEQLQRLSQIAAHAGTDPEHLVKDAALRLVEEDEKFRGAVREGIAAADRGEFVEHEEVWANVEKILRS